MKRLTKLQKEYIDKDASKGSIIAFNLDIFKSKEYKEWKRGRRLKKERQ